MNRREANAAAKRVLSLSAWTVVLVAAPAISYAEELPALRKGIWEFNRTVETAPGKTAKLSKKECTTPFADAKKMNENLLKAGCKFTPLTRSGNSYSFTTTCKVGEVPMESKSVISIDSPNAYKIRVESRGGGKKSTELLVAKRVADC